MIPGLLRMAAGMLLAAMAIALSAAQSMFRSDAAHSGLQRDAAPRAFHRVKWTFATGDAIVSSPVWDNGRVIFGSADGRLYALK